MKNYVKAATPLSTLIVTGVSLALLGGGLYYFRTPIGNAATSLKDKIVSLVSPQASAPVSIIAPTPFPTVTPSASPLFTPVAIQKSQSADSNTLPQAGPAEDALMSLCVGVGGAGWARYVYARYAVKKAASTIFVAEN